VTISGGISLFSSSRHGQSQRSTIGPLGSPDDAGRSIDGGEWSGLFSWGPNRLLAPSWSDGLMGGGPSRFFTDWWVEICSWPRRLLTFPWLVEGSVDTASGVCRSLLLTVTTLCWDLKAAERDSELGSSGDESSACWTAGSDGWTSAPATAPPLFSLFFSSNAALLLKSRAVRPVRSLCAARRLALSCVAEREATAGSSCSFSMLQSGARLTS
jgi:hypothetical protein